MTSKLNYYEELQISPNASMEEIVRALSAKLNAAEELDETRIVEMHHVLLDPQARQEYDRSIQEQISLYNPQPTYDSSQISTYKSYLDQATPSSHSSIILNPEEDLLEEFEILHPNETEKSVDEDWDGQASVAHDFVRMEESETLSESQIGDNTGLINSMLFESSLLQNSSFSNNNNDDIINATEEFLEQQDAIWKEIQFLRDISPMDSILLQKNNNNNNGNVINPKEQFLEQQEAIWKDIQSRSTNHTLNVSTINSGVGSQIASQVMSEEDSETDSEVDPYSGSGSYPEVGSYSSSDSEVYPAASKRISPVEKEVEECIKFIEERGNKNITVSEIDNFLNQQIKLLSQDMKDTVKKLAQQQIKFSKTATDREDVETPSAGLSDEPLRDLTKYFKLKDLILLGSEVVHILLERIVSFENLPPYQQYHIKFNIGNIDKNTLKILLSDTKVPNFLRSISEQSIAAGLQFIRKEGNENITQEKIDNFLLQHQELANIKWNVSNLVKAHVKFSNKATQRIDISTSVENLSEYPRERMEQYFNLKDILLLDAWVVHHLLEKIELFAKQTPAAQIFIFKKVKEGKLYLEDVWNLLPKGKTATPSEPLPQKAPLPKQLSIFEAQGPAVRMWELVSKCKSATPIPGQTVETSTHKTTHERLGMKK